MSRRNRTVSASLIRPQRSIVLVGLMGVGKTTVGRRLAKRLQLQFTDTDAEIEKAAGMPVAEIFATTGEADFRRGEREVIRRLLAGPPMVLAYGGGAFVDPLTRKLTNDKGLSIWLDADIALLAERVSRNNARPLLHGKDPKAVLAALAETRNPLYAQAHVKVHSSAGPHSETVNSILEALAAHPLVSEPPQ